jgi:hypothetical protein
MITDWNLRCSWFSFNPSESWWTKAKAATERNGKNESKAKSEQRAELKAKRTWEESNLQRK